MIVFLIMVNFHEIHCDKENVYKVKKILEKNIETSFISTGIEWVPLNLYRY